APDLRLPPGHPPAPEDDGPLPGGATPHLRRLSAGLGGGGGGRGRAVAAAGAAGDVAVLPARRAAGGTAHAGRPPGHGVPRLLRADRPVLPATGRPASGRLTRHATRVAGSFRPSSCRISRCNTSSRVASARATVEPSMTRWS